MELILNIVILTLSLFSGLSFVFLLLTSGEFEEYIKPLDKKQFMLPEVYGVGFKLGNEELRDTVQKTLDAMVEDGTFMKIAEKWDLTDSVCLGK